MSDTTATTTTTTSYTSVDDSMSSSVALQEPTAAASTDDNNGDEEELVGGGDPLRRRRRGGGGGVMKRVWGGVTSNFYRYCMSAFAFNSATFVFWIWVQLTAESLSVTSFQLGVIQSCASVTYTLLAFLFGVFFVDRFRSGLSIRIGVAGFILVIILCYFSRNIWLLGAVGTLSNVFGAFFWPSLESAVASETSTTAGDGRLKDRRLSLLSMSHSFGKALGWAVGGLLQSALGNTGSFVFLLCILSPVLLVCPLGVINSTAGGPPPPAPPTPTIDHDDDDDEEKSGGGMKVSEEKEMEYARAEVFMTLGYISNFTSFGMTVCIGNQFIKRITEQQISLSLFGFGFASDHDPQGFFLGVFCSGIFFVQTAVLALGGVWTGWQYSRLWVYITESAGGLLMCLLMTFVTNPWLLLVMSMFMGVHTGFAYISSLAYGFHTPIKKKGKLVGIHQSLISAAPIFLPPIAGAIATATGDLRAPYFLCAALVAVTILSQEIVYQLFWRIWFKKHPTYNNSIHSSY